MLTPNRSGRVASLLSPGGPRIIRRFISILLCLSLPLAGCTSFALSRQTGVLPIPKHERASEAALLVERFEFDEDTLTTFHDRAKWRELLIAGLDQSNIFATVGEAERGASDFEGYTLSGTVRRFRFEKNWVPTFIPFHVALSFFTLGAYTIFGGPTTGTAVRMTVDFELKDASGELVTSFRENYASTRAVNIYTSDAKNPYNNPNVALASFIDAAAGKLEAALQP
ncbi:MAG: hypothetical protein GY937_17120 [bacterium]|nr:hypothetical protein [bacterium]